MFSKFIYAAVVVLSVTTTGVLGHAGVSPALGVKGGDIVRGDVQNPSTNAPCGKTDIVSTIDSSTFVTAQANGSFTVNVTDFNPGQDGSRHVTASIDHTGTGKSFQDATVLVNGDNVPTQSGSQNVVVQLPSGVQCGGGTTKDLCVASFKTTAGFGNCVVVRQSTTTAKNCKRKALGTRAPRLHREVFLH